MNAGGSGGHIYPLLAVAESLRNKAAETGQNLELRFYGDAGAYKLHLKSAEVEVRHIASSKLRRYFSILNFIDFFKFIWSFPQALWKIFWFMPDIAFSKGGPGSIAVLYACRFYRIPVIIHESDAVPSLTTRLISKFAKLIELAFPDAAAYLSAGKTKIVGNPIRVDLKISEHDMRDDAKRTAKTKLGFDENLPLILILGGSQGAQLINDFVLSALPELVKNIQILHQIGVGHYSEFMRELGKIGGKMPRELNARYKPVPFLQNDLKTAYVAADLAISRAGAGAIFELATAGKPAILVPLPDSANDHQNENAFRYREAGACEIIREENLESGIAENIIVSLLKDSTRLQKLAENAKKFSRPDAADTVANDIFNLINL